MVNYTKKEHIRLDQPVNIIDGYKNCVEYGHMVDIAIPYSEIEKPIPRFTKNKQSASYANGILFEGGADYGSANIDVEEPVVLKKIRVKRGDMIGCVGSTGNSSGSHLHIQFVNRS